MIQKQPPEVFCKKGVIINFAKFTWKHLCWCLFFDKVDRELAYLLSIYLRILLKSKYGKVWKSIIQNLRSSHQRCSMQKVVPKNFTKFTGKHLCQSLFFNKVSGLRHATLLKKRFWQRCFPVNFCEISKNTFFTERVWTTVSKTLQVVSNNYMATHDNLLALYNELNVHQRYLNLNWILIWYLNFNLNLPFKDVSLEINLTQISCGKHTQRKISYIH